MLKSFFWPTIAAFVVLSLSSLLGGIHAFTLVTILALLEISLSLDNAVVNTSVLDQMTPFWRKMFLSVGILIAVFGVRLVFPLLIVSFSAQINPISAFFLALNNPKQYSDFLQIAHPAIAGFGSTFLLMIFLNFVFEDKPIKWLKPIEENLSKISKLGEFPTLITLFVLLLASLLFVRDHTFTILIAGSIGVLTFLGLEKIEKILENRFKSRRSSNLFLFFYLELLDTIFSIDGVIGALAISNDIFIIAAGLGIGAFYVRSLTLQLLRKRTLSRYVYIDHGAHYALGVLALILLFTIDNPIPQSVTVIIGLSFIVAAFVSSVLYNKNLKINEKIK